MSPPWWWDAVFYEVYVRSFADADGDGIGDLEGVRRRLPHLADLGVDALWLTPFYPSPMADHGYDVADPRGVDPLFGDLAAFDRLVADAHGLGLAVTIDVVPNHTSSARPWFVEALAAGPGSPERERYVFREGRGEGPPNNWRSNFGGPAWTQVPDGQWYLHLFAPEQPDLDWRHPDVIADAEQTLRFWLDRGVDGFRIDVAHGLVKAAGLPDLVDDRHPDLLAPSRGDDGMYDQPEVHDIYRGWRRVLDSYPGDRMAVGEVWLGDPVALARYVRPDELQLAFNFQMIFAAWDGSELRAVIDRCIAALAAVGARSTWTLSNHDVVRHVTRYGAPTDRLSADRTRSPSPPAPDDLGVRRARAAALLLLALPGPAYLYQGEELGLPEVDLPDEALQDPIWQRSGHTDRGRDGCRVPLPWSGAAPPYDFSPPGSAPAWLPQPTSWAGLSVAAQTDDPNSMLSLYRTALALRGARRGQGDGSLRWRSAPDARCLSFVGEHGLSCVVNLSTEPVELPAGEVVLASVPLPGDGTLPWDAAVWLR